MILEIAGIWTIFEPSEICRVPKGHYGTKLSNYSLIIQILTVSVDYSSIKRPMINLGQLIEAGSTDGVRHCYSNYLKKPISNVLNSLQKKQHLFHDESCKFVF